MSFTLKIKDEFVSINRPWIMAIINLTEDSFYDKSRIFPETLITRVQQHIENGANCIDLGAMSTKPGSMEVSELQEKTKLLNAINQIRQHFPNIIISIDTYRSQVAKACILSGADIINDVSGGDMDTNMFQVIVGLNCPYIMMHMQGTPFDMQLNPNYTHVTQNIYESLSLKLEHLRQLGISDVIIDPGFGFGKTLEHNYQLLRELNHFSHLNCPILVGLSRKSMIYKPLNISANEALNGTTFCHTLALKNGANILRVHDVKAAKEVVTLFDLYHQR